jgi:hypothetical protein
MQCEAQVIRTSFDGKHRATRPQGMKHKGRCANRAASEIYKHGEPIMDVCTIHARVFSVHGKITRYDGREIIV